MSSISVSDSKWIIAGASVIGQGHIKDQKPCQDAHFIQMINKTWGVAVVCDGAGSDAYSNSHLGSQYVAEQAAKELTNMVRKEDWNDTNKLPTENAWNRCAIKALQNVRQNLEHYAVMKNVELKTLACTVIALAFSPHGVLSVHIGDGRAGYRDDNGEWDSAITPFKGSQVGETVFITSEFDWEDKQYIETKVIDSPVTAFTLLTDGLEWYCWECNVKLEDKDQYIDPNKPFKQFFDTNAETVKKIGEQTTHDELQEKWRGYLGHGHPKIKEEQDDKTMVLGVLK